MGCLGFGKLGLLWEGTTFASGVTSCAPHNILEKQMEQNATFYQNSITYMTSYSVHTRALLYTTSVGCPAFANGLATTPI